MTYGPRETDGGYQAPSTDAVRLERRELRKQTWTIGSTQVELGIVELTGGRPELFEVYLMANDRVIGHTDYIPCMLRGGQLAQDAFALTAGELDAGYLPDRVVLPAGAQVGW